MNIHKLTTQPKDSTLTVTYIHHPYAILIFFTT